MDFKHQMTKWGWMVIKPENLYLGKNTDIGSFCLLVCHKDLTIEDGVQIGSHVSIYTRSTIDGKEGEVIIEKGAKIGTHSTIMPGVTIGEGATVGAMSFVNCDIPAGETWYGVPARKSG